MPTSVASGAVAQSNALDATANNIANATTTGFHGDRITFREALGAAKSPDVALVGAGTTRVDTQAGALSQTNNPLDLALEGDGMFAVDTPNGVRYTRAGNFKLADDRSLVTVDGYAVRGEGGAGTIRQGMLEVSNVNVVEEMIDLISGQRAYEINSRVIKAADEMLGQTAQLR
jgi:flagellar basal body rod protein FlgG